MTLRYVEGCPNRDTADARVREAAERAGLGPVAIDHELVASPRDAERLGFRGSPTVLIDGVDPFADERAPVGLTCRMYETETGREGAPSVTQLAAAFAR